MRGSTIFALIGGASFASAGGLAAAAVSSQSGPPAPPPVVTREVTIPAPTPNPDRCIKGYSPGILVINSPGGHTNIYTCIQGK